LAGRRSTILFMFARENPEAGATGKARSAARRVFKKRGRFYVVGFIILAALIPRVVRADNVVGPSLPDRSRPESAASSPTPSSSPAAPGPAEPTPVGIAGNMAAVNAVTVRAYLDRLSALTLRPAFGSGDYGSGMQICCSKAARNPCSRVTTACLSPT
jgi:hypothetical protein